MTFSGRHAPDCSPRMMRCYFEKRDSLKPVIYFQFNSLLISAAYTEYKTLMLHVLGCIVRNYFLQVASTCKQV